MGNLVAIVGRPNVGKSTLFNRLIESKEAIVDEISGVTRDRHYGRSDWNGREFSVIDTGGYVTNSEDVFEEEIRKQVLLAMDEANVILFVVDVLSGITDLDEAVALLTEPSKEGDYPENGRALEEGNMEYYWRWRQGMAEQIASQLDAERFGVKGLYLFGSTKNGTAGPGSGTWTSTTGACSCPATPSARCSTCDWTARTSWACRRSPTTCPTRWAWRRSRSGSSV